MADNNKQYLTLLPLPYPGALYRSAMPFSYMFDPDEKILLLYRKAKVRHVVVLPPAHEILKQTGTDLMQVYAEQDIQVIACPVEDFSAPPTGAFNDAIQQVIRLLREGAVVAVHCHAGIGRTGMFSACLAREAMGFDGPQAVRWVRTFIPGAVETDYQVQFVDGYKVKPRRVKTG